MKKKNALDIINRKSEFLSDEARNYLNKKIDERLEDDIENVEKELLDNILKIKANEGNSEMITNYILSGLNFQYNNFNYESQ